MDFYSKKQRRAQKEHTCMYCGKAILPGSMYISERGRDRYRRFHVEDRHIHCEAMMASFVELGASDDGYYDPSELIEWVQRESCAECDCRSGCDAEGRDCLSCELALERLLPPQILGEAKKSVRQNTEV